MQQNMGMSIRLLSIDPMLTTEMFRPICPQARHTGIEEDLFGLHESQIPVQTFGQDEFECLNLNITCPGELTPKSRLPVMFWIHGYVPMLSDYAASCLMPEP
jgi:carboxylesterase type B